ncbi:hypothetical protein PMIN06_000193 [Paraphaeosphaeria minitans]
MSYMLQFPASPLPKNVTSPPFVLFGINDLDLFSELPTNIPLTLVLHFAPVLLKWLLPPPEELSTSAIRMSLRTPYVGINILADMELEGLGYILARMMQLAHIKTPTGNYQMFQMMPSLSVSIAIHKAWMALVLPPKGIEALYMHIQTTLMIGMPVTLFEIKGVWHNFSVDSPIQREMGQNFVRNYIDRLYPPSESSAIRHWYLETTERWSFFRELEKSAPTFGDVQKETMEAARERKRQEDLYMKKMFQAEKYAITSLEDEKEERHKSRRERREKRERGRKERAESRRLERARSMSLDSVSSVETVIWNPVSSYVEEEDPTVPTMKRGGPVLPHSKPVDSSALTDLLKAVAVDEKMQSTPYEEDSVEFGRSNLLTEIAADKREGEDPSAVRKEFEKKRIAERNASNEKRIELRAATNGVSKYVDDYEEDDIHETMEYIPPDLTCLTKLKLKSNSDFNSNSDSVLTDKKYRTRRHAMYETDVEDGLLVEKAPITAAEVLPTKSPKEKTALSPKYAKSSGAHRTLEEELASINTALSQLAAHQHAEQSDVSPSRQMDKNISQGPDGFVHLQPIVYEGTR